MTRALAKIEWIQGGWLERIFMPGHQIPEPSLLRTHPKTQIGSKGYRYLIGLMCLLNAPALAVEGLGGKMGSRFNTFEEFWPFYVTEHSVPINRALHFIGTATLLPLVILAIVYTPYIVLFYPVCAYGMAWFGHFVIEKNKPATFKYPLWSLLGDYKMFWLMLRGKMSDEVARCKHLI